jgi:hypothetical protein
VIGKGRQQSPYWRPPARDRSPAPSERNRYAGLTKRTWALFCLVFLDPAAPGHLNEYTGAKNRNQIAPTAPMKVRALARMRLTVQRIGPVIVGLGAFRLALKLNIAFLRDRRLLDGDHLPFHLG